MLPRSILLAGGLLITASAALLAPAAQEGTPEDEDAFPVLDLQRVRYDEADDQAVMLKLHELRAHMVQHRTDLPSSALVNYVVEPHREVYFVVRARDGQDLLDRWQQDDPQLERLVGELVELGTEDDNVFLRQVAGVRREGQDVVTRRLVCWTVRARIGKLGLALEIARELADHVNAVDKTVEASAYVEYFGRAGTIWWFFEVQGPAEWEQVERRLHSDPVFLEILDRGAEAFVDDSFDDRWMGPI